MGRRSRGDVKGPALIAGDQVDYHRIHLGCDIVMEGCCQLSNLMLGPVHRSGAFQGREVSKRGCILAAGLRHEDCTSTSPSC